MALKGNLRDFSLYQLLNLINLAHKTGALTVNGPQNLGGARLYFKEGKLIDASIERRDPTLTEALVRSGKITPEQAKAVQDRASVHTDKELGLLLINGGILSQSDIVAGVRAHLLDTVYQLFTWPEGGFVFEPNQLPAADRITVPVPLDNIIIEGSQRVQETERLREELPDLNVPLRFAEQPSTTGRKINLTGEEWRVISYINSRNTVKQIAEHLRIDELKMRRLVYGLRTAGLIHIGATQMAAAGAGAMGGLRAPGGAGQTAPPPKVGPVPAAPAPAARFTRNVLLRIIDGIRRR